MAVIVCDMDGTLCSEERTFSRSLAVPLPGAIAALTELRAQGHKIIIYSARSWAEYEMTSDWLEKNDVPHDQLVLGKPIGDIWIDDRAIEFRDWESTMSRINGN